MESVQDNVVENREPKKNPKRIVARILIITAIAVASVFILFQIVLQIGFMFHTDPQAKDLSSYDELEEVLRDDKDIILPDLSSYKFTKLSVGLQFRSGKFSSSQENIGYGLVGFLDRLENGQNIYSLSVVCSDYKSNRFHPSELTPIIKYDEINVNEHIADKTEIYLYDRPEGILPTDKVYEYYIEFEMDGYQYFVEASQLITNYELKTSDINSILSDTKDEALKIAKSIIDQKETE